MIVINFASVLKMLVHVADPMKTVKTLGQLVLRTCNVGKILNITPVV